MTVTCVKHDSKFLMVSIHDDKDILKYPYLFTVLNVFKTRKEALRAVFKHNYESSKSKAEEHLLHK